MNTVLVTLDHDLHSIARRGGRPTSPFTAEVIDGAAPFTFWNRVRRLTDGEIIDLPPMYRLTPTEGSDQ